MKCTKRPLRILTACAVLMILMALGRPAKAGGIGADTIALFPKNTGEFGYADLKKARTLKWFPALQEQVLPERFRQFEKFLASAGVDPNTQVEELAWGLVAEPPAEGKDVPSGEQIVGIALGNYNPETTEAYFKQQKLPTSKSSGYTLFAFGSGVGATDLFFFFIDSSKAAFGQKQLLEKMIEARFGREEGLLRNDKMYSLINEAGGSGGVVWAVLDQTYTRIAMGQLAPEVQQFPEAAKLVQRMQSMMISANTGSGLDGKFQAVCGSPEDANTLSQLMTAGLMYKKYQTKDNPELGQLIDQTNVSPSGERLIVRMSVSDDQMASLIRRNTFAFKM